MEQPNILKHEENSAHCFFPHRAVIKWREKIRKEENPEEDKGEEKERDKRDTGRYVYDER